MEDLKRGTGRTTRMILAVGAYLASDTQHTATIVIHNANWGWMRSSIQALLSENLAARISIQSYTSWQRTEVKGSNVFFDHHCFHDHYCRLKESLQAIEAEYTKYDL